MVCVPTAQLLKSPLPVKANSVDTLEVSSAFSLYLPVCQRGTVMSQ